MELVAGKKIPVFDHVIDNLYLGDIESVHKVIIEKNKITSVVNISNSRYEQLPNVTYYNYDIDDESHENITQFFSSFISIVTSSSSDSNVLVHCANSVSRSVTLVLAYLLTKMNLLEAIKYLKSKRTQYTRPNIGFIKQLIKYEHTIYQQNSVTTGDFLRLCK